MKALTNTNTGDACTIEWMFGTPETMRAMEKVNLREGSRIRIIQKMKDCLIIGMNERRIVLGNDVACRIQVGVC